MGRTSRIARKASDALALAVEERRNRTRLERDDSQRYYDRVRAELAMQRGLI
ncbi:hypothetical protein [Agrococcus sp. ARC_14]|uniref:hypothetical protein n=1 Tax=Agrococcus sp. ARC_14 TaxID=2919927 RepID=UPI001F06BB8F|nr:hypothetical protein [Agrococcus sp. ARC_14]MCH1884017.1 hypothetical protein [Agrococcus sp. ARC_14]